MAGKVTKKELGQASARLFRVLDLLQEHDITIAGGKVLLEVHVRTMDIDRPHVPSPSELAESLGMSVSSVSRMMQRLAEPDGPGLLQSDRAIPGSRAEAYVLTPRGRTFIGQLLEVMLLDRSVDQIEAHSLGSYARARWEQGLTSPKLQQVSWDEGALTLVVQPREAAQSDEVQARMNEFLSPKTKFKAVSKGIALTFTTITDAVYFKLRWC